MTSPTAAHGGPLHVPPAGAPLPIAIGPANCELVTGVPWRYLRIRFAHLLIALGERKHVIPARALEAELAGRDARDEAAEAAEEYAARLGLVDVVR